MPYNRAALKCPSAPPRYQVAFDLFDGNQRNTILADTFDLLVAQADQLRQTRANLSPSQTAFSDRASSDGTTAACKHLSGWYYCRAHAPFRMLRLLRANAFRDGTTEVGVRELVSDTYKFFNSAIDNAALTRVSSRPRDNREASAQMTTTSEEGAARMTHQQRQSGGNRLSAPLE